MLNPCGEGLGSEGRGELGLEEVNGGGEGKGTSV